MRWELQSFSLEALPLVVSLKLWVMCVCVWNDMWDVMYVGITCVFDYP